MQIEVHQEKIWVEKNLYGVKRDAAIVKVGSAKTKLDSVRFPRDTEHNCRIFNIDAAKTFRRWISRNPHICSNGRMSFKCELTVLESQVKFVSFFDPTKRSDGLGSERYASYHGWQVGPHTVRSKRNLHVLCTSLYPYPQPHDVLI